MSYWYLATPYLNYKFGKPRAHADACEVSARLLKAGWIIYSPIAHSHYIAVYGQMEGDCETWWKQNEIMMRKARGIIVVKMDGWDRSAGIQKEINYCKERNKYVVYMDYPLNDVDIRRELQQAKTHFALREIRRHLVSERII